MPNCYGNRVTVADASGDPTAWKEVMASTDKEKWIDAMEKEMESLYTNEVWDLVELPKYRKQLAVSGYTKPREVLMEQLKDISLVW